MDTKIYTKKEKERLFEIIILPIVSRRLKHLKKTRFQYSEMCQISGIKSNRMSEAATGTYINEDTLSQLIEGGFITVEEIKEQAGGKLTDKDIRYLDDKFSVFAVVKEVKRRGVSNEEIKEALLKLTTSKK